MKFKFYKDSTNEVFSYPADGSQDHLIGDKTLTTQEYANSVVEEKIAPQRDHYLSTLSYLQRRLLEYPPVEQFIDAWVKDDAKALKAFKDAYLAVDKKYPKPK